ncbi:putative tail protein [Caulobacter phage C1]|nr:putative tail protein [Caulobacter phage C1]UTU08387.1 putative tail protein [Caulobacter phage C2]UTU08904.1 putative tail protein [Caulobacter phage J4]UTU09460.1 putative tail protein [Caulobacter phage BL47]UTU10020.1 putative tail protein [Caulobacter phage RB23]WGN97055.1 putative tail protein [Bertelyvirus sp.]
MAQAAAFAATQALKIGISYLFPSDGPRLKDLKLTASTYGAAIPWVFGMMRVPGNMIWAKPIREKKKKKFAGKGGFYNQYTYYGTFAMALCKGPVKSILRIWADNKIIYDATAGTPRKEGTLPSGTLKQYIRTLALEAGNQITSSKYKMRFYTGSEDQVPDSTMDAHLGVGNAPAFRGTAYILFDDIPLADFGNRIPQITAEVFIGELNETVIVENLFEADGDTPLATDYSVTDAAFDWSRNYAFLRYGTSVTQVNLRTYHAVKTYGTTEFQFPGGAEIAKLHACGQDSFVYATYGPDAPTMPLAKLDPYSLQMVATQTIAKPLEVSTATDSTAIEHVIAISETGAYTVMKAADLSIEGADQIGSGPHLGNFKVCGRDPDVTTKSTFYVFHKEDDNTLKLVRINGAGQNVVDTMVGTGMEVGGAFWDTVIPGVILFWKSGGQAYISKWGEDRGAEVWRASIPGYPERFDAQTRINGQLFCWEYGSALFGVDTSNGLFKDQIVDPATGEVNANVGKIDWDDYMNRYPDVQAAWLSSGTSVAGSREGFAQWHYENYGKSEGRTVNNIGEGQGQGFPLPEAFEGEHAVLQAFSPQQGLLVALGGIDGIVRVNTISSGVSVATVLERLFLEAGLTSAQMDLNSLYQIPIRGYGWANGTDIKSIIDELGRLYLFDISERQGVMTAIPRAPDNEFGPSTQTIPQNALGSSSPDAVDFWQETRLQEVDLPSQVSLTYMNWDQDYETGVVRSKRITNPKPTMYSRQQVNLEMNMVMSPTEAKVQVNKILYSQWGERTKHTSTLPWALLNLDPSDIVTVEFNDGRSYIERVHRLEFGADYHMAFESYGQDSGAYENWDEITTADGGDGKLPAVLDDAPRTAIPFILNTPLLRDSDDAGGAVSRYYVGIGNGYPGAYQGAGLFKSTNLLDYTQIDGGDNDVEWATVVGKLPVPHAGPFAMDWQTRLKLVPAVSWFELESITDDELWQGLNPVMVGDEVIQFRDAIENDDGTWTIWNLLRGRRGTEYACNNHVNGERFIFLNDSTISQQGELINARGQARYFKAVAQDRTLQETAATTILYEPRDLMPYAPVDIRREFATDNSLDITWARRTRYGGGMVDGTGEVPLGERFERYEVYVLPSAFSGDLSRGAEPVGYTRKFETTNSTISYTPEMQAVDGFNRASDTLHLAVYQLSDAVGRGFPGVRSILPTNPF